MFVSIPFIFLIHRIYISFLLMHLYPPYTYIQWHGHRNGPLCRSPIRAQLGCWNSVVMLWQFFCDLVVWYAICDIIWGCLSVPVTSPLDVFSTPATRPGFHWPHQLMLDRRVDWNHISGRIQAGLHQFHCFLRGVPRSYIGPRIGFPANKTL